MKSQSIRKLFIISMLLPLLSGCYAGVMALSLAPTAIMAGANVYNAIEEADINAAVSPSVTKEELGKIKRIALIFVDSGTTETSGIGTSGSLTTIVRDNLALELLKEGFEVVEAQKLKSVLQEKGTQVDSIHMDKAIKAGKLLGVQAIVVGAVSGSYAGSFGPFTGQTRMHLSVLSASIKIIGVEKADTLMVVTINYKNGQNPSVAAESLAVVFKAKIEDPFGDVKERLKTKIRYQSG
jgi:hypothetical protein